MTATNFTEFILLGFSGSRTSQLLLFGLVMAFYTAVVLGNLLIMMTVRSNNHLFQSPMYFFISNLSLFDLCMGSVAAPKLATDLLNGGHTISYGGCMTQVFFLHFFGGVLILLLTLMAYDRYVAICHPLRYTTIMHRQRCLMLASACWIGGLFHSTFHMLAVAQLSFCGSNVLDNFYCDVPQLIQLSCINKHAADIATTVNSSITILSCMFCLLFSYIIIVATLCGRSGKGGMKAFSTCTSHLTVVALSYGPAMFVYVNPSSSSQMDKMASLFYLMGTPALNPLIYSLRNKEMKGAMKQLKSKCKVFLHLPRD